MTDQEADDQLIRTGPSFFRGLPEEEVAEFLESLERRTYPAGSIVVAEGDQTGEIYVAQAGHAEAVVAGPNGLEQRVGQVLPGETVGEMSLLTGLPAAATVRAVVDFDVLVVTGSEFASFSGRFPEVYKNLGSILAERLSRTNRLVAQADLGRLIALDDDGSPPLLGYALACSVAWHTREPTLLIALRDHEDDELARFATLTRDQSGAVRVRSAGADLLVTPQTDRFAPGALPGTMEALLEKFRHVLVQGPAESVAALSPTSLARLRDRVEPTAGAREALLVRGWVDGQVTTRPAADGIVDVPALAESDLASMRKGTLPATTAAGRSLGWAARDLTGLKVGLALGAGSLRGWAHLGVIEALQDAGLEFDYIAGTSVGAAVAGLFALGHSPEQIAEILTEFSPNLFRLTVPFRSLLSNRGMTHFIKTIGGDARLEELRLPIAIVAADIMSQREVVFRRGSLWQAVLTSVSIPGIYPASPMGKYMLVDGGVLNPVPTNVVSEMGAGTVIAVRLAAPTLAAEDFECVPAKGSPPSAIAVLLRSVEIMQSRIASEPGDAHVVTIVPSLDTAGMKLHRFAAGRRFIPDGAAAAEAALPRVAAALPWLRP